MYLDTIAEQAKIFFYSCGFGFLLGVLFDVFELAGDFFPKRKISFFVRDIAYMVICTFLMFLFNLAVGNGTFRLYIYASSAMGWVIYYVSVGSFTKGIRESVSLCLKSFFRISNRRFTALWGKLRKKKTKNPKKSKNSSDLLLQDDDLLLYNKKDNSSVKEVE